MSRLLTYSVDKTTLGSPNGIVTFNQSLILNARKYKLRLIDACISSNFPNVFNYGGINTGLLKVTKDAGVHWTTIQLPDGSYSTQYIQAGIAYATSTWWTDVQDPGIIVRINLATGIIYITLDETKFAVAINPGDLMVDLKPAGSTFNQLLGFVAVTLLNTGAGTYTASTNAEIDYYGNYCSVRLIGFGDISIVNTNSSRELVRIPFDSVMGSVPNVYHCLQIQWPYISISPPSILNGFTVEFIGGNERPMLISDGNASITFELVEA